MVARALPAQVQLISGSHSNAGSSSSNESGTDLGQLGVPLPTQGPSPRCGRAATIPATAPGPKVWKPMSSPQQAKHLSSGAGLGPCAAAPAVKAPQADSQSCNARGCHLSLPAVICHDCLLELQKPTKRLE
jgi:hypothetical protein